ncbi:uncharacterized protein LOC117181114 [Belonocnema kinseyi]|uniref:uncharacterized protein LOC117181114 n=1 Tax=Belonocnema kinseyi TaxID=2817044 RepID=UPI00143DB8A5|nr:uncharacterized protein LOC117181114 [Belonocnema kinseyi]
MQLNNQNQGSVENMRWYHVVKPGRKFLEGTLHWLYKCSCNVMTFIMGLQQQTQAAPQDTVDYSGYLQSSHNHQIHGKQSERQQLQVGQNILAKDHNTSVASTKGLLNGPGQNNCFLNSAVQVSDLKKSLEWLSLNLNVITFFCFHDGSSVR